jgi:hypothetical protein
MRHTKHRKIIEIVNEYDCKSNKTGGCHNKKATRAIKPTDTLLLAKETGFTQVILQYTKGCYRNQFIGPVTG